MLETGNDDFDQGLRRLKKKNLQEISKLASWSVSSFKTGCDVNKLLDNDPQTFWQSDGPHPHYVDIHFAKRVSVERVSLYLNFAQDESYTPSKISLLSGTGFHDLIKIASYSLNEPCGWYHILFESSTLETFLLRICVDANHQHGKDTHIRCMKVFSNMKQHRFDLGTTELGGFTSDKLLSETSIR